MSVRCVFIAALLYASLGVTSVHAAAWRARHGMTSAEYQKTFDEMAKEGYRLRQVDGYSVGGRARFAAIWDKTGGPASIARHNMSTSGYQAEFDKQARKGYRLVHVSGYADRNQAKYAAIWVKKDGPAMVARHAMTPQKYQQEFDKHVGNGYRLVHVDAFGVGNKAIFSAIWEKKGGGAWNAHHGMSSSGYQKKFDAYVEQGYRLTHVSGYREGGKERYAAIWEKKSGPAWRARHAMTSASYQSAFDNHFYRGYNLASVSGFADGRFAAIWTAREGALSSEDFKTIESKVKKFMDKYSVPGLAFAITKDGRLVFAQGYGWAREGQLPASPETLWRIASVSKPITSVAIMKLKEQNKLSLGKKVFGPGSILGTKYGKKRYSSRLKAITVKHLLQHTAGGWSKEENDPMFQHNDYDHAKLISWTLDNQKQTHDPGKVHVYSNFGYCLLGRVIEKLSGKTYAHYVKTHILKPAGIRDMHIGGNTNAQTRSNEAHYYGQSGQDPDCCNVRRMDSHGGWIASAVDLLRFAVRVDGKPTKPDLLSAASIKTMTTGSKADSGYAAGWRITDNNNWWHGGRLNGTSSILVRTDSGYTWTVLLNTRPKKKKPFGDDLDDLPWHIVKAVKSWPSYDLF